MTGSPVAISALLLRCQCPPSAYFREEHEMLRDSGAPLVEQEVKPKASAWEEQASCARSPGAQGELGFLGIRFPPIGHDVATDVSCEIDAHP